MEDEELEKVPILSHPEEGENTSSNFTTLRELMRLAGPIAITYLSLFSQSVVAQVFVRGFSVEEVAGYGLASMVINFIGLAPITGIALGLDVIIPQAYGVDPKHPQISIVCQRALAVLFAWCVPVALLLINIEPILLFIGAGNAAVVHAASKQLGVMVAVLPMWSLSEVLQCYLGGINQVVEMMIGTTVAALANPILLYFIADRWLGYLGIGCVVAIDMFLMFFITLLAAFYTGVLKHTWNGWSWKAFVGWKKFLRIALPCLGMMLCEWSGMELNTISAVHFLKPEHFAAITVCSQTAWILIPCPTAVTVATGIRVGNCVGAGKVKSAVRSAVVGGCVVVANLVIDSFLLFFLRHYIGIAFTESAVVQKIVAETIPSLIILHFCDTILSFFCGVVRALGYQVPGAILTFISWWVVGVPVGWAFITLMPSLGPSAFFYGPAIGLALGAASAAIYLGQVEWIVSEEVADALAE